MPTTPLYSVKLLDVIPHLRIVGKNYPNTLPPIVNQWLQFNPPLEVIRMHFSIMISTLPLLHSHFCHEAFGNLKMLNFFIFNKYF